MHPTGSPPQGHLSKASHGGGLPPPGGAPVFSAGPPAGPPAGAGFPHSMQQPLSHAQQQHLALGGSLGAAPTVRQSERVLLATASSMAQKSYNEGNYALAKRLLDSISLSYRHEGWKSILTTILLTSLDCAMRLRHTHDAIMYSMELMGHNLLVTPQQKIQIMSQMLLLAASPPAAPLQPADAPPGAAAVTPFDVQQHVFDVDRRHGLLSATSHFLTVPSSATPSSASLLPTLMPAASRTAATGVVVPVSSQRDPFVCVQEEFDLVLTVAVAFPAAVTFNRMDVYFYAPPPPTHDGSRANIPPSSHPSTPYHLVLLPGGAPSDDALATAGSSSDRDLPVLRPEGSSGVVRADLNFPGVAVHNHNGQGAAGIGAGVVSHSKSAGSSAFTFTFGSPAPSPSSASQGRAAAAGALVAGAPASQAPHHGGTSRTYRVRMKATQATTTNSATLNLPLATPGASPQVSTPAPAPANTAMHIPGANQALFVTTVVASLAVPDASSITPAAGGDSGTLAPPPPPAPSARSLQLKLDVLPSKHEETFTPTVELERLDLERKEREKKAKKKGLLLPPSDLEDVSLDPSVPARTPTLRILPQHARAHLGLLHPSLPSAASSSSSSSSVPSTGAAPATAAAPTATATVSALVGEFYPLQVRVCSDGDEIKGGELVLLASSGGSATGGAAAGPAGSPSPMPTASLTSTPSPNQPAGLKSSGSADGIASIKSTAAAGGGATDDSTQPPPALSPPSALPSAAEPTVRFYRLAPAYAGLVGRPPPGVASESLFEEILPGIPLAVPPLPAGGEHATTVFLRSLAPLVPGHTPLSLTLSYTNQQGVPLSVTSVVQGLGFRMPFKVRCKVFSDALSGMGGSGMPAPTSSVGAAPAAPNAAAASGTSASTAPSAPSAALLASQPHRLILSQPVLLHVELENVSGAALRLDEVGLELSGKFFRNTGRLVPGSATKHVLRNCVSPAAGVALAQAAQMQSPPLSPSSASSVTSPCVCLAPGEKYTHLFTFVPLLPGKTRYTPLQVRWNRITPMVEHSAATAAPVQTRLMRVSAALRKGDGDDGDASLLPPPSLLPPSPPPSPLLFPTPSVPFRRDLLYFHILKAPLLVRLEFPPSARFGQTFPYVLRIANGTEQMHDVELTVLEAEGAGAAGGAAGRGVGVGATAAALSAAAAQSHSQGQGSLIKCVLSGQTRGLLRIRPHSTCVVSYRVCPLECGSLALPRIQLKAAGLTTLTHVAGAAAGAQAQSNQSVLLADPSDVGVVFVHPIAKTPAAATEEVGSSAPAQQLTGQ